MGHLARTVMQLRIGGAVMSPSTRRETMGTSPLWRAAWVMSEEMSRGALII
jgi:hypothetical protein